MMVLDASVVVEFVLGQRRWNLAVEVIDRVTEEGGAAPSHWRLEVLNALVTEVRRGGVSAAEAVRLADRVSELPVDADHAVWGPHLTSVQRLANSHRLTAYDAAYLELAVRRSLPLATFDQDLAAAARRENVTLLI